MTTPSQGLHFGPFHLDVDADTLRRDGLEIPLRPQAMRVLQVLAARSGQNVTHAEIMQQAWGEVSVSKHTVAVTIAEVRRALGEYATWIRCHPRLGYRLEIPQTEELVRLGWHHLHRHTREGFEKAVRCFTRAMESGGGGRAFEGAARAWLLMGAYGMRPPAECWTQFRNLHQQAVEASGWTPRLRADYALWLHVGQRRFEAAEAELLRALGEQPRLAEARAQLAMFYVSRKRFADAEREIQRARATDRLGPALALSEILVRFCCHQFEAAAEYGRQVLDLHPYFPSAMVFYGSALEALGRWQEALEQYKLVCILAPDIAWHRVLYATCLAKAGFRTEARALCEEIEAARATGGYVDPYHYSLLWFALGESERGYQELEAAFVEQSPMLVMLEVDAKFDALRGQARFEELLGRVQPQP
jgi:DNA-binding winged helix-turn-helix (wHTH) protein/tetratricopeptide (TPR) repeat protein